MKIQDSIYIDGQWVPSAGGGMIEVVDPATEEVVASAPAGTAEDVDLAARAASAAFPLWSQSVLEDRILILNAASAALERRSEEVSAFIAVEIGKPITLARGEVGAVVEGLRRMGEDLPTIRWEEIIGTPSSSVSRSAS